MTALRNALAMAEAAGLEEDSWSAAERRVSPKKEWRSERRSGEREQARER